MIRINLLPKELIHARQKSRRRALLAVTCLLVLTLWAGVYGLMLIRTQEYEAEAETYAKRASILQAEVDELVPYEQLEREVLGRSDKLQQAFGTVPDWAVLMDRISLHIPDNVWLTHLAMGYIQGDSTVGRLVVKGQTYDHPSTAGWLTAMGEIEGLADSRCHFTVLSEDRLGDEELVQFETSARILPGPPYEPPIGRGE